MLHSTSIVVLACKVAGKVPAGRKIPSINQVLVTFTVTVRGSGLDAGGIA